MSPQVSSQYGSALCGVPFARQREFRCGAFLTEAGCPATTVYLLRSGQVRCFSLSEDGCEATTAVLGPGQLIGLSALFGIRQHLLFAEALTPVRVWALPTAALREQVLSMGNPMLLGLLAGALAQRFAMAEGLLRDVLLLPVRERLGDVQQRLVATLGGRRPALSQSQLARLVQARPETLTRVLGRGGRNALTHTARNGSTSRTHRQFRSGDVLDWLDTPAGHINRIVAGELQLVLAGPDKREVVPGLDRLRAGDFVGVSGLVGLPPTGLRAIALEDGGLETLSANELLASLGADPDALPRFVRQLGRGLMQIEHQLSCAAVRTVRQRLVAHLREVARESVGTPPPVSHAVLARRIGTSRETVTRALRLLEEQGVITRDGRRVTLQSAPRPALGGLLGAQGHRQQPQHRRRVYKAPWNPHDEAGQLLVVER